MDYADALRDRMEERKDSVQYDTLPADKGMEELFRKTVLRYSL